MNKKQNETILVLVVACIILHQLFHWQYLLTIALVLGLIGILVPPVAQWIHWMWMKLGHLLGYLSGRIILTVIFFVVLYPLSLASRVFRKKEIVKLKKGSGSYFKERDHLYTRESMENTW